MEKGQYESQLGTKRNRFFPIRVSNLLREWMDAKIFLLNLAILLLLWLDPSVLQVSEEIIKALHTLLWLLLRERCFTACLEGPSFEMQLQRSKILFCQDLGA